MNEKMPAVVLGATGSVGQRFVQLLDDHPWFQVVALTGSQRSIGKTYQEACRWNLSKPMPGWAGGMVIRPSTPESAPCPLAFSALPAVEALQIEPLFAQSGSAVCSNASAFRRQPDVPILLPEVNPDHAGLVETQRKNRGWSGCIVTNPNCSSTGITVALKALQDAFGVRQALVVTLQALSGAGYPGVASMDIQDNLIPWIEGEEDKVEWEPRKMLGEIRAGEIFLAELTLSAHTNRVPISDGHTACLSVALNQPAELAQVEQALRNYQAPEISRNLPSAPQPVIHYCPQPDRPQPRLDRMFGKGMTTVVGRLRPDPIVSLKMVVLSHNTIRGAAGGSIYNAELLYQQGMIKR